jgi:hypothetical protein
VPKTRQNLQQSAIAAPALICTAGMYKGLAITFKVNQVVVVGTDPTQCNVVISQNASAISPRHCSISFDSATQRYIITDFSVKGTYLMSGVKLASGIPTACVCRASFCLGSTENTFILV